MDENKDDHYLRVVKKSIDLSNSTPKVDVIPFSREKVPSNLGSSIKSKDEL
jgi:hypothetical protein